MVPTNTNCSCIDINTFIPKCSRIPASMADVSERGIWAMTFSKSPVMPDKAVKRAANINAPTASGMGTPDKLVTSNTAPGVDQPVKMGWR